MQRRESWTSQRPWTKYCFAAWLEFDQPSAPGPRIERESGEGPVPLAFLLERWPVVAPFLPWLPGRRLLFSLYQYSLPTHQLLGGQGEDEDDEEEEYDPDEGTEPWVLRKLAALAEQPSWRLLRQTDDWRQAGVAFNEQTSICMDEKSLHFDRFFAGWRFLGEALRLAPESVAAPGAGANHHPSVTPSLLPPWLLARYDPGTPEEALPCAACCR